MPDQPRRTDADPQTVEMTRLRRAEPRPNVDAGGAAPTRPKGFSQRNARPGRKRPAAQRVEPTARSLGEAARRSNARSRREAADRLDIVPDMPFASPRRRPADERSRQGRGRARRGGVATWVAGPALIVAAALAAALIPGPDRDGLDAPIVTADVAFDPSQIATASHTSAPLFSLAPAEPPAERYLDGEALLALLAERPLKCLATGGPNAECRETVLYDGAFSVYTRRSVLDPVAGVSLEINGAFSVDDGAICHRTDGASALVVGVGADAPPARSMERIVNAALQSSGPAPVCHRLREARDGGYVADAYVDGAYRADMTDPRPFLMLAEAL